MSKRIRIERITLDPTFRALAEASLQFNAGNPLSTLTATPTPERPEWEERMAPASARNWQKRDRTRFLPPDRRPDGVNADYDVRHDHWLVFAWKPYRTASGRGWVTTANERGERIRRCRWTLVAEKNVRRGRRKPMTMARLFASLRQQCGLDKFVPMKLTTTYDHAQALAHEGNSWFTRPPQHHTGRGNT